MKLEKPNNKLQNPINKHEKEMVFMRFLNLFHTIIRPPKRAPPLNRTSLTVILQTSIPKFLEIANGDKSAAGIIRKKKNI